LVEIGKFRSDLFFRLNVIELAMPSLRERREDIPMLAKRFLSEITQQWAENETPEISSAAMKALIEHNYTGNVRELINILQRAVTMCEGKIIMPEDLMLQQLSVQDGHRDSPDRDEEQSLDNYIEDIEKQMLEDALKESRYNKTRAAALLGISFRSLRYKLKKFNIE
jgi:two-component system response regulator PilR (NtrC family)